MALTENIDELKDVHWLSKAMSTTEDPIYDEQRLCVGDKIYELIDLTDEEVSSISVMVLCSRCIEIEQAGTKEKTLLSFETKAKRVAGPPRLLYDAFGEALTYTPEFHVSIKFN
jgi:hypothetical protein